MQTSNAKAGVINWLLPWLCFIMGLVMFDDREKRNRHRDRNPPGSRVLCLKDF